jgi:hypothetical protein
MQFSDYLRKRVGEVWVQRNACRIDFVCWASLGLSPLLYLINGPPVTSDQTAVRVLLVAIGCIGIATNRFVRSYDCLNR